METVWTQCLTGASCRESKVNTLKASLLALPTLIHLLTLFRSYRIGVMVFQIRAGSR